jgi:rSAM/selenodomain-associated transferase 2
VISVIIPVLNEEKTIGKTLESLIGHQGDFEIIVVDGGSTDKTVEIASQHSTVLASKKGRAQQMNTGAGRAKGEVLFFHHADCLLEKNAFLELWKIMEDQKIVGGAMTYHMDETSLLFRNHIFWSNLRAGLTKIFLGDHGIFVRRSVFDRIGGYPIIPLMEDVALCRSLKKEGPLVRANSKMISSSRRFKEKGFLRTVLQLWSNRLLYFLGVPAEKLAGSYEAVR